MENGVEREIAGKVKDAVRFLVALGEAIREAGPQGIPSGHLYAAVMAKVDLESYQRAIGALTKGGLVGAEGQMLVWKGGEDDIGFPKPATQDIAVAVGITNGKI
jgi:hypothetical protein